MYKMFVLVAVVAVVGRVFQGVIIDTGLRARLLKTARVRCPRWPCTPPEDTMYWTGGHPPLALALRCLSWDGDVSAYRAWW